MNIDKTIREILKEFDNKYIHVSNDGVYIAYWGLEDENIGIEDFFKDSLNRIAREAYDKGYTDAVMKQKPDEYEYSISNTAEQKVKEE